MIVSKCVCDLCKEEICKYADKKFKIIDDLTDFDHGYPVNKYKELNDGHVCKECREKIYEFVMSLKKS